VLQVSLNIDKTSLITSTYRFYFRSHSADTDLNLHACCMKRSFMNYFVYSFPFLYTNKQIKRLSSPLFQFRSLMKINKISFIRRKISSKWNASGLSHPNSFPNTNTNINATYHLTCCTQS